MSDNVENTVGTSLYASRPKLLTEDAVIDPSNKHTPYDDVDDGKLRCVTSTNAE
jgi:hypothetical protein